jgi:hypothetical protein
MKNVLPIISLFFLFLSCKNDESFHFKNKLYKRIENEKLFNWSKQTVIGKCDNCEIDSLKMQSDLFKRTDYDTLKYSNENKVYTEDTINFIDLVKLSFIDSNSKIKKKLNFYNPRYSYSKIKSWDNVYITKVNCNSNTLTITLSHQSIDTMFMKFSIMKNDFILKKIYMKDHYLNYLDYINELDTAIVYDNNSVVDINYIFGLINKTTTKKAITDSIAYKLSLPR